ncbi:wax ester/triacylglycerol synthase domain-containing protein [Rhodococcoides trifolii]|nr:wax ester/triacylglycerol synthase domain-containing protein [Rhodococcus trifolii]
MSSRDALNFYFESTHTSALLVHAFVLDAANVPGAVRTQADANAYAESVMHLDPIFTKRLHRVPLDLDFPYWISDSDVDLAHHVFVHTQAPGDTTAVRSTIVDISRTFFDFTARPAWELHFLVDLHGIDGIPDGGSLFVIKFHHSAIDGVGASDLVSRMLAVEPAQPSPPRPQVPVPGALAALRGLPRGFGTLAKTFVTAARMKRSARGSTGSLALSADTHRKGPATRFNVDLEPDMVWDVAWFDLDRVREVKTAIDGGTVNDVMLTAISLAYSSYLAEHWETPAASLRMSMPMNTRTMKDATTANQLAILVMSMHTDIADPVARLQAIHDSALLEKKYIADATLGKNRQPPNPLNSLPSVLLPPIGKTLRGPSKKATEAFVNTMISNVTYGRGPLQLNGAPVVGCLGVLPTVRGVHLAHSVRSVGSSISISVASNRAVMPDIEHYMDLLQAAMSSLS